MKLNNAALVEMGNHFAGLLGCTEPPELDAQTVGKMGLKVSVFWFWGGAYSHDVRAHVRATSTQSLWMQAVGKTGFQVGWGGAVVDGLVCWTVSLWQCYMLNPTASQIWYKYGDMYRCGLA